MRPHIAIGLAALMVLLLPATALCWGDEGHEIIGLIAEHYLEPAVRTRVVAILARDSSGLTRGTGIAEEATWADKFRDSDRDTTRRHYLETREWHFVDLEIDRPDPEEACFRHPPLPAGTAASEGPADDCILDKIDQFRRELR
ncbi:MAG TPA: S1/P1 nuclease, partial [Steroidobacteraceae bacterium]|nr:S1/P1 nuclease [Steroidobacteraceae bacterium]